MEELEQLISDCKAGKREAQSKLYKMYSPKLFGLCMRYTRDQSEAEDCLHEGFVIIFSKVDQFSFKGSFEGWMKRIMVNVALERFRKRNRMHTVEDVTIYDTQPFESTIYSDIGAKQLLELVQELPPRYKMVFNLYGIDGYSHKEIAKIMGIEEGTSKSNLARARKILREKVKQIGYINSYAR